MSSNRSLFTFTLFLCLFLLYFIPLPLHGQLPGNVDTLLGIALSELWRESLGNFISGTPSPTIFFPETSFLPFGENCFGLMATYLFFKAIAFGSEIWGYYLLTSTLMAASAFGVYRLASLFVADHRVATLAGLAFPLAGFTLGNIDDLNVVFVMLPALSLYFLERGVRESQPRHLILASALAGLQIWFGFYVFLFQCLTALVFFSFHLKSLRKFVTRKDWARIAGSFAVTALPLVVLYLNYHYDFRPSSVYEVYNEQIRQMTSLKLHHFWNVLENNRLSSSLGNIYDETDSSITSRLRKSCYPGLTFTIFLLIGLWKSRREHLWLIGLTAIFLTLSFGTNSPLFLVLERLPLGDYLRIPLRFYLFALLIGFVLFAIGVDSALKMARRKFGQPLAFAGFTCVATLVLLETTPYPLKGYAVESELRPPTSYVDFFRDRKTKAIIFDIPSNLRQVFRENGDADTITTFGREILYMIWQTHHLQIILGGVSGYQPPSRNDVDRFTVRLPNLDALLHLKRLGATHLVFHKRFIMLPGEDTLGALKESSLLKLAFEDDRIAIFAY